MPKNAIGEYFDAIIFHRMGTQSTTSAPLLLTQSVLTEITAKKTELYKNEIIGIKATETTTCTGVEKTRKSAIL